MNKKTIAIAITAAMLVSLLPSEPGAAAKKQKPTMPKQITVNAGKSRTIKITGKKRIKKTKWSLGKRDKKIISIRGKKTSVVVKGKKSGKAVLTAKVTIGKKSYKLKTSIIVKDSKGKKTEGYSTQQPRQTQPAVNQGVTQPILGSQNVLPSTKKPSLSPTRKPAKTPVPAWPTTVVNGFYLPRIDENEVVSWDCLYFGNYWQEDTNDDGKVDEKDEKQPIKWRVLSIENNTAFLLADRSLASRPNIDEEKGETSWENSEVRKWLNNDFYNDAFSEEEKQGVVLKTLDNTEDTNGYQSGNNTRDKVALLSLRELAVERYGLLRGRCSRYTCDGNADWAVRTIAVSESIGNGFIDVPTSAKIYGSWRMRGTIGIRPIIYLNLSSKQWKKAESVSSVPYELEDEEQTLPQIPEVSDEVTEFDDKNIVHQGVDGSITWKIDKNGCLLLEGNGDWEGLGDSFVIVGDEDQKYPKWLDYSDDIISAKVKIRGITNCHRMFGDCTEMKAIDLSEFDTSKVTDMEEMFRNCFALHNIDLSALDTSNVQSMYNMFYRCKSLRKLIFGDFNTKNVTNMRCMFDGCESIQELDLSAFNTKKVQDMDWMFYSCKKMEKLNLSSFDLTAIEFEDHDGTLFELTDLENLVELKTPKHLSEDLFIDSENWGRINTKELPKWTTNTTPWKDDKGSIYTELPVDAASKSSITLTRQVRKSQRLSGVSGDLKWNVDSQGKLMITGSGEWKEDGEDYPDWHEARDYITSCEVDVTDIKDASDFFADLPYLQHITFTRFDTSKTTNMSGMFYGCLSLKQLDLSGFDTSNVEDMSYMFSHCESLCNLDISSFDVSKVTNMSVMFAHCYNLKNLDLRNFEISKEAEISTMFGWCFKLESIQLDCTISDIDSVYAIFYCCHNLQSLDLSKWDLSQVESGGEYFLSGEVSLSQIKTPVNLSKEVSLPDGIWKDEDGNRYTVLPQNRTTSILLKKE